MIVAALLLALPAARYIEWAMGHDAAGNPAPFPSATNLVLILAGLFLSRIWFRLFLGHSFMTRSLAAVDPTEPRRTIRVSTAWVADRRAPRFGLDLGNRSETFGWIPIGQTTMAFDPSAAFGLAGKVGVRRGAVLVSPASGQIVISWRLMKAVRPDRRLHPLGPTADRLLGWTTPAPIPELPTTGRVHVRDWGTEGPNEAVTNAAFASRARLQNRTQWVAGSLGLVIALLYLAPSGTVGLAIALAALIGCPLAVLATIRSAYCPLTDALRDAEGLDDRQARTLAVMVLHGGLGKTA